MSNPDSNPVDRDLKSFSAQRERDLRELERGGPPIEQPELRAAFLRQMDRAPSAAVPDEEGLDHSVPLWRIVGPRLAAAALLLILGGVGWMALSSPKEETVVTAQPDAPVDLEGPGVAMGESSTSEGPFLIESWIGDRLTLRLDGVEVQPGYHLDATIRRNGETLDRARGITTTVHSFDLDQDVEPGQSVDLTVRLVAEGRDRVERARWDQKLTRP